MNEKCLISIIAPVKNEKDNIKWTIDRVFKSVHPKFEILIIYDDKKDDTLPEVNLLLKKYKNIRLIHNDRGSGVLNAIIKGFDEARGGILVMMAVDRTDDPKTINKMYKKITEGYDIVCPSRYSQGGQTIGKISLKSVLSRLSGILTPHLLGIPTSDLTYSYKMFKKKILKDITIKSKGGFEFAEELLIKSYFKGYKVTEVPTLWVDRKYGRSKFQLFKWLPRYTYWYVYGLKRRLLSYLKRQHSC